MPALTRRAALLSLAAAATLRPAFAAPTTAMTVYKDPNCGCCADWVAIMQEAGFEVTVHMLDPDALQAHKSASGITPDLASCHTAHVEGYVIEGHVPAADIRRLLADRPDAIGLTVPGMPYGAPGMGPEIEREAYSVLIIRRDGVTDTYARYEAA